MTQCALRGYINTRQVYLNGKKLDPERSLKARNHSPDGFNWGYGGSGPAQLALAIMLELTGDYTGYQAFKENVISRLPLGRDFSCSFEISAQGFYIPDTLIVEDA
jgi:hypothetical protein